METEWSYSQRGTEHRNVDILVGVNKNLDTFRHSAKNTLTRIVITDILGFCLNMKIYLLLLITGFIVGVLSANTQEFCVYQLPDGRTIDLNRATKDTDYSTFDSKLNYYFYLNICKDAAMQCNGNSYGGVIMSKTSTETSMTCATYMSGKTTASNYAISLIDTNQPDLGVVLTVTGGELFMGKTEQMKITMNCASDEKLTFIKENYVGNNLLNYEFAMNTPYSCIVVDKPIGDLGILGLILVLLIVLFVLYFLVGYILNATVFKKDNGWKLSQLPQYSFWKNVIGLFWEGILFMKEGVQSLIFKYVLRRAVYNVLE